MKPILNFKGVSMGRQQIERTYGVHIVENGYTNLYGRYVKLYDLYSADGCRWETGMKTIKAVEAECKEWKEALLGIKVTAERNRAVQARRYTVLGVSNGI